MVFTDAKTVIIDEKEVKSIILQDGGILYEKESAITESIIIIQSNKTILSAADNESCILTANVTGAESEKIVHTYTDTNYHETPQSYALQLNSNSVSLSYFSQTRSDLYINGQNGRIYLRNASGTTNIGQFNVEKPIFFDFPTQSTYYYDQNDQLVTLNGFYIPGWQLSEGDSFDIIEYPLITFKSNILKSDIIEPNDSYSCSSENILLNIDLSNMGSNISIQGQGYYTIEISKNNTGFTITYNGNSFDTNNPNLILIRDESNQGWIIKKENGEYLWIGTYDISNINIDSGFITIDEYYYKEKMFNPYEETSVTYYSRGAGDVTITAECCEVSDDITIEDCIKYDDATIDKSSSYSCKNLENKFKTDRYRAIRMVGNNQVQYYSLIYQNFSLPTNYEISIDILPPTGSNKESGLCIADDYVTTYINANQCFLYTSNNRIALGYRVNGNLTNYGATSQFNTDIWYTFTIKVEGTTVTSKVLNGNTVIHSWTGTLNNIQSWKKAMIVTGGDPNEMQWRNLKIKPL